MSAARGEVCARAFALAVGLATLACSPRLCDNGTCDRPDGDRYMSGDAGGGNPVESSGGESTGGSTSSSAVRDARAPLSESTLDAAQQTRGQPHEVDAACPDVAYRYPDGALACVECTTSNDCNDPALPLCDPASHRCVVCTADGQGCGEGERCRETTEGPVDAALVSGRRCVECTPETATSDCRAHAPFCVNDRCAVCDPVRGEGCGLTTPYCRDGAELAEEWTRASEAGASMEFATVVCSQCRDDDDCVAGKPRCVAGTCAE